MAHGIELAVDIAPDVGVVRADELRMKQVVLNLFTNAVKFTPDGGSITVVANRAGDFAEVTVRDTGVGIPAEDQERIFDAFQQGARQRVATRKAPASASRSRNASSSFTAGGLAGKPSRRGERLRVPHPGRRPGPGTRGCRRRARPGPRGEGLRPCCAGGRGRSSITGTATPLSRFRRLQSRRGTGRRRRPQAGPGGTAGSHHPRHHASRPRRLGCARTVEAGLRHRGHTGDRGVDARREGTRLRARCGGVSREARLPA